MTSDKDQQIGGLLMWVPMCFVYLIAIIAQLARWFSHPLRSEIATLHPQHAINPSPMDKIL